jgi:hypothetical protein
MDISKLTIAQLKDLLRSNKIKPLTGNKSVLVQRVKDNNIYENHIKKSHYNTLYKMNTTSKSPMRQPKAPKEKKPRKPRQTMISGKNYIRHMNQIFVAGGYKLPSTKTIESSTISVVSAYYLEKLFPDILKYNVYALTKEQVQYILNTISMYGDYVVENFPDEYANMMDRININHVVRTVPQKKKQQSLPTLEDIDDIRTAMTYVFDDVPEQAQSGQLLLDQEQDQEPEQSVEISESDEEYPEVKFEDMIVHHKPSHTKLDKLPIPQKIFQDELEFYETIQPTLKRVKKIPKYEPPQNYAEQQDFYEDFETYGEYDKKGLVFENATEYITNLKKIRDIQNKPEFIKMVKAQIKKSNEPILFNYLHELALPLTKQLYDLKLTDDSTDDYDTINQMVEDLDAISDIIAKAQYALESDRYKQFLNDIVIVLDTSASPKDKLNIIINYYVKYKYILASKIKELISSFDIKTIPEMISQADEYINDKKEADKEIENKRLIQEDNKKLEKMRKEDEARRKKEEADELKHLKKIQMDIDREEERGEKRKKR